MPFLTEEEGASGDAGASASLLPSPGKDPSRLMQDIFEHTFADPQIHSTPPHFDPTKPYRVPEPSHIHSWVVKSRESLKSRPWNIHYEDSYLVAGCESCRMHMSLTAIITSEEAPRCGSKESVKKSHHFHLESWTQQDARDQGEGQRGVCPTPHGPLWRFLQSRARCLAAWSLS